MLRTTQDRGTDFTRVHISYDKPDGGCSRWHTDGLSQFEAQALCDMLAVIGKELQEKK